VPSLASLRHLSGTPENLEQNAVIFRIEVLDEHDGKARIGRHMSKQKPERFEPAGGRPDAHHSASHSPALFGSLFCGAAFAFRFGG